MNDKKTRSGKLTTYLIEDGSIPLNKKLIHHLGANAAIFYGELVRKYDYFESRGELTEDGYFYNSSKNMEIDTGLSKNQQPDAIELLEKKGLIKQDTRVVENSPRPQKVRHFKIIFDYEQINKVLNLGLKDKEKKAEKLAKSNEKSLKRLLDYANKGEEIHTTDNQHCTTLKNSNVQHLKSGVNKNKANKNKLNKDKGSYSESNSEKVETFSFANKAVKDLINQQKDSAAIESNIYKYMMKYAAETGNNHPRLKLNQWQQVVDNILYESDRFGVIKGDYFSKVVDQHFNTDYNNGNCDYNILHFINGRNIQNRVYELTDELEEVPAP